MNRHDIKIKRLESCYQKIISEILLFKIQDSRLNNIPIFLSNVFINNDLSLAKVLFFSYEKINEKEVKKALNIAASFFLREIKKKIKIGFLPKITFIYDNNFEKSNHVSDLIQDIKNTQL